ncbi:hypothetical protein EDB83DRAFT_2524010 [Lactarius deliciosus]|nr:hypothetical protein EDB83DRAFT_2524010 [Lactarius deliciosus]
MPLNLFLKEFVPTAPTIHPTASFTFSEPTVSQNEDEFIQVLQGSRLCLDLQFMNTMSCLQGEYNLKPDISAYPLAEPCPRDWGTIELWIKNKKNKKDDPCGCQFIEGHQKSPQSDCSSI